VQSGHGGGRLHVLAKSKRTLVKTTTAAIIDSGDSGAEQGGLGGEWMRAARRSLGAGTARRRERRDGRSVRSILIKIDGVGGDMGALNLKVCTE
jgi:hypothetical protein